MSHHILLVEDSRSQALRVQLDLTRCGLAVDIAVSGAHAFKALRSQIPDAIILDIDLPDTSGYMLCRALKTDPITAHIPVILLTHREAASDTIEGAEAGADDYIPKDCFAQQNLVNALYQLGIL